MTGAVHVCDDPIGAQWQLGALPAKSGRLTLIGWYNTIVSADAFMPPALIRAMAAAMTSVARMTFFVSEHGAEQQRPAGSEWTHVGGDHVRAIPPDGLEDRARALLGGMPAMIVQLSTARAQVAERFFDDADYPLWLQAQVALLSAPGSPPPVVDRKTLLALIDEDWTGRAASLVDQGVLGILRPGVDGDMLGFLSLDDAFGTAFLGAMEASVRSAGFGWANVSEADF